VGLKIADRVERIFLKMTGRGFTRIFIIHEDIHATRVVTLSAEELDTMSKNNLRGITLGIRPI